MNQDEEIPFFSPAAAPAPDLATDNDEADYTTLTAVSKHLKGGMDRLRMDFNSVDAKDVGNVQIEILARQKAYAILAPIDEQVDSAIDAVKNLRKG